MNVLNQFKASFLAPVNKEAMLLASVISLCLLAIMYRLYGIEEALGISITSFVIVYLLTKTAVRDIEQNLKPLNEDEKILETVLIEDSKWKNKVTIGMAVLVVLITCIFNYTSVLDS